MKVLYFYVNNTFVIRNCPDIDKLKVKSPMSFLHDN